MGPELGYTGLSLGENACKQLRVVARARACSAIYFPSLSDRSRARVLLYLCLFMVAAADHHVLGVYPNYALPRRPRKNNHFFPLNWNQMLEQTGDRAPHFIPRDDQTPE